MPPELVGQRGDRLANQLILGLLDEAHPWDSVLSEESADDSNRLATERVWIIDPLDGTREFTQPGRWDWAVHVALVNSGRPIAAAVDLPALGLTLATSADGLALTPEAPLDGLALPLPPVDGRLRLVLSASRPPPAGPAIQAALDAEVVSLGSAGAKAMAVVLGQADVYAHAGGQYEWDSAAPVGVALAAGLHASRLDGSPLIYNQPDPWMPDLLVCRPELAERVIRAAGPWLSQ